MGCAFETILSMIICLLKVVPSLNIDQDKKKKKITNFLFLQGNALISLPVLK